MKLIIGKPDPCPNRVQVQKARLYFALLEKKKNGLTIEEYSLLRLLKPDVIQ